MGHQSRSRQFYRYPSANRAVHCADCATKGLPDADSLIIRKNHQSGIPPPNFRRVWKSQKRRKSNRLTLYQTQPTLRGYVNARSQIVMLLKDVPSFFVYSSDFDRDFRPAKPSPSFLPGAVLFTQGQTLWHPRNF